MFRWFLVFTILLWCGTAWADADSSRGWTKRADSSSNYSGPACGDDGNFRVNNGQSCFHAFGTGTDNTTAGSTALLDIQSPDGGVVCFDPDVTSTSTGVALTAIYILVADDAGTTEGSMDALDSALTGTDCYLVPRAKIWIAYPANSVPGVIRVTAR